MSTIKFKDASNGKTYKANYTDEKGNVHTIEVECYTDDNEMMELPAVWDVQDTFYPDGTPRTYGPNDEFKLGCALDEAWAEIVKDLGVEANAHYDAPSMALVQE